MFGEKNKWDQLVTTGWFRRTRSCQKRRHTFPRMQRWLRRDGENVCRCRSGSRNPCDSGHKFSSSSPPLPVCPPGVQLKRKDPEPRNPPPALQRSKTLSWTPLQYYCGTRSSTAPTQASLWLCARQTTKSSRYEFSPQNLIHLSYFWRNIREMSLNQKNKHVSSPNDEWIFVSDGHKGNKCVSLSLKQGTNILWYR